MTLTSEQAARELLARKQARRSLLAFTLYTKLDYRAAPFHALIAEKLDAVARGQILRLKLRVPPRHGKSELASRRFPAFYLGWHPNNEVISASYNSDLARTFGREVRTIVNSRGYRNIFQTSLAPDSQAADLFHTIEGGSYLAAGVGSGVTGRGANVLIIDDPFKDAEEADSATIRENVWNWYVSTAYTRLESPIIERGEESYLQGNLPALELLRGATAEELGLTLAPGAIVLINTRWHDDDLDGRIEQTSQENWEVIDLPAVRDGRALWPAKYDLAQLDRIRETVGPRYWQALYQQHPTPDEGTYFKHEWLRYYDEKPKHLRTYGASDYAVTHEGGDYTCHTVWGVDPDDSLYLLDLWREKTQSDVWVEQMLDMMSAHETLFWAEEAGQIEKSVGPYIVRRQRERKTYGARFQLSSSKDKPTRARSYQARMSAGKVYLPRHAPWLSEFIDEHMRFPLGKNDDQVDCGSLIGRLLDRLVPGQVPGVVKPPEFPQQMPIGRRINLHLRKSAATSSRARIT